LNFQLLTGLICGSQVDQDNLMVRQGEEDA